MSIKKLKFGRIMSILQSNWFMVSVCQKGEKQKRSEISTYSSIIHCIISTSFQVLRHSKEMIFLFWFWIVLTICHVAEKTMGQQCPSERSISGWMLQRHIYETMLADIALHCSLSCSTDDRCQSFNFVISSHMCEFNNRTKEAKPEDFIPAPDRYYFRKPVNRGNLNIINLSQTKLLHCKI